MTLMSSKYAPIYDQLFKDVYAFEQHALELIKSVLKKDELSILDLSGISLVKDSFTKGLTADLLYSIPLKAYPRVRIPLLILFEHKSSYKPQVLIQVLGYMCEVIKRYNVKGQVVFPPLLAILFSHGHRQIKGPLSLQDLLPKEWLELQLQEQKQGIQGPLSSLSQDMLNYTLRIYDVHDPHLQSQWDCLHSRIALYLFKDKKLLTSSDERVLEGELVHLFQGLQGVSNQDIILSAVQYHLSCRNPKIDLDFFNRCLKLASDKDSELVKVEGGKMGAYIPMVKRGLLEGLAKGRQEGIAEGRQEGIAEGRQEGIAEGRQEGMEKGMELVAHNMLKENMNIALISQVTGLSQDHILKLKSKS